jgi:hypothetical protein
MDNESKLSEQGKATVKWVYNAAEKLSFFDYLMLS